MLAHGHLVSHALELVPWSPPDQSISLKRLVILNMIRELCQRVSRGGALGPATEERHEEVFGRGMKKARREYARPC